MKFKMAENSIFAILLRSPWWISMVVVGLIALLSVTFLSKQYAPYGVFGAFPVLIIGLMAAWRQMGVPSTASVNAAMQAIGAMSWRDFSGVLEQGYIQQGYAVTRLSSPAADFSVRKDGRTMLVSAKRWKAASQGVEALRDLVAAKEAQDAGQCTYICVTPLSEAARRYAQENSVRLLSPVELAMLVSKKR